MRRMNHKMGRQRSPHDTKAMAEAKLRGETTYPSDKPCPKGHVPTRRRMIGGQCVQCARIQARAAQARQKDRNISFEMRKAEQEYRARLKAGTQMQWDASWGRFEDHPYPFIRGERYIANLRKIPFVRAA